MKKFWNLMLAALVIIGATACTENYDGIEKAQNTEGFSFYAEVVNDGTRAYIDNEDGDKTWNTVWEQGDKLIVKVAEAEHGGGGSFQVEFECKDAAKGQFVSYDSNAANLQGQNVTITTAGTHHSLEGKEAFYTNTVVNGFDNTKTIELEAHTSFFRYTFNGEGEVKLTLSEAAFRAEDGTATKEVTISGTGEKFVAFWPTGNEVTLSFVVNGETKKEATKALAAGMVYNLGEIFVPVASEWAIVGAWTSADSSAWREIQMYTTPDQNVFVAEKVYVEKDYSSMLIKKFGDATWTPKFGGGIVYFNPGNYMQVYQSGSDISITKAGTYDFYFDYANKYLYVVEPGADYTKVAKQTVEGKEPVQEEPEVTDKVVYLKPNNNWTQANARFAAYFFGNGEVWVSMTAVGDGTYEVHIPEGYDYGCDIIFCRMNPSTTANNWNNKWNQTSDLKTPKDGKNLYTVKAGTWDKGGGTWSKK